MQERAIDPEAGASGRELSWGRRFLMCPPEHFEVVYAINPWMRPGVIVDRDRAREQWATLRRTLEAAGARVEVMDPQPGLPDLVFTANAGIVNGGTVVTSRFRFPERRPETAVNARWFAANGFRVEDLPAGLTHEGAGDVLPFGDTFVGGHATRSDLGALAEITRALGVPVVPVELVDERMYHVDLTFCPLDDRHAIVAPMGWNAEGRAAIEALVPEPLVLQDDEALQFCANSVVVGRTIVMPAAPPRVARQLEAWGLDVQVVDVGEFAKAGGSVRCLTLALDVDLPPGGTPAGT